MKLNFHTKLLVPAVLLVFFALADVAAVRADTLQSSLPVPQIQSDSFPLKITKIFVNGNKVTRADIIRMYIGLDTGMTYDSALAAAGKRRLLNTNLYSKVDVVPIRKHDGVNVYIIITELFYLFPEVGGDLFFEKYGDDSLMWWRLHLGLTIQNFLGDMETFSVRGSIWDDRSLSLAWSKPISPSPYFLGLGAGIRDYPEINFPRRRFLFSGRITGGRTLLENSRVYLSIAPTFTRIDTLSDFPDVKNTNVVSTSREVNSSVGWSTDHRDRSYDPTHGWMFCVEALTNALYAGNFNRYLQFSTDIRLYHHGFFNLDRFAYRLQAVVRANDAGVYRGLYIGGEGTIRGYASDQFGLTGVMNDYGVLSAEYRFPLWTMPCLGLWKIAWFDDRSPLYDNPLLAASADLLKEFYLRFDGALIGDAGDIFSNIRHPLTGPKENAGGVGVGIRAMAPTLRRSLCFDVVWRVPGTSNPITSPPKDFYSWKCPAWHLYLDMYY
jgi:outer membrane protein assembly factor BamA